MSKKRNRNKDEEEEKTASAVATIARCVCFFLLSFLSYKVGMRRKKKNKKIKRKATN